MQIVHFVPDSLHDICGRLINIRIKDTVRGPDSAVDHALRHQDLGGVCYYVAFSLCHPGVDAVPVHRQLRHPAPVRFPFLVLSGDRLRDQGNMIRRVYNPGMVFFVIRRLCPSAPAASAGEPVHNAGDVFLHVCHRHHHVFRLRQFVFPAEFCDLLRDRCIELRQRQPALPADREAVQRFPRVRAQIQPVHRHRDDRLSVQVQTFVCPDQQLLLRVMRLVCFRLLNQSIGAHIFLDISGSFQS